MEIASSGTVVVRRANQADAKQIFRLLQSAKYSHNHADWRLPADWLETPGFAVGELVSAEEATRLIACLAVTADPPPAAWVRVAAMRELQSPAALLKKLFEHVMPHLLSRNVDEIGWLAPRGWPNRWLKGVGFEVVNRITTYIKDDVDTETWSRDALATRPATEDDMQALANIEEAAFEPLWRHSAEGLALAYRHAFSFDVAERDGRLVGFQYSVRNHSHESAHLVRITVSPEAQGTGAGSALMIAALDGYRRSGIRQVTLNTQVDNISSQRLYEKFGFFKIGETAPVWVLYL